MRMSLATFTLRQNGVLNTVVCIHSYKSGVLTESPFIIVVHHVVDIFMYDISRR